MRAILTFHAIDERAEPTSFPPDGLRRLVDALLEDGVRILPLQELLAAAPEGSPAVTLTFDDGHPSVHAQALPILHERGLPALAYVVSEARDGDAMGEAQLRELLDAGFEIGGHTAHHVALAGLSEESWRAELADSRSALEDALGIEVRHFAYPFGRCGGEARRRVRAIYETAATTSLRYLGARPDPWRLPRLDAYYLRRTPHASLFAPTTRARLAARRGLRLVRGLGRES